VAHLVCKPFAAMAGPKWMEAVALLVCGAGHAILLLGSWKLCIRILMVVDPLADAALGPGSYVHCISIVMGVVPAKLWLGMGRWG
jgi:hypothetical protein